jgi:hypothetical protein
VTFFVEFAASGFSVSSAAELATWGLAMAAVSAVTAMFVISVASAVAWSSFRCAVRVGCYRVAAFRSAGRLAVSFTTKLAAWGLAMAAVSAVSTMSMISMASSIAWGSSFWCAVWFGSYRVAALGSAGGLFVSLTAAVLARRFAVTTFSVAAVASRRLASRYRIFSSGVASSRRDGLGCGSVYSWRNSFDVAYGVSAFGTILMASIGNDIVRVLNKTTWTTVTPSAALEKELGATSPILVNTLRRVVIFIAN